MNPNSRFAPTVWILLALALLGLFTAGLASADDLPNADQTEVVGPIEDPTFGFWKAIKTVQLFNPGNTSNPCPDTTKYCYVYTITNDPSSQVNLVGFGVQVPAGTAVAVSSAGVLPGSGVQPDSTNVLPNEVRWEYSNNPITPGATTEHMYINSTYGPGNVKVTINGDGGLDSGDLDCLGPVVPPNGVGTPMSCTIGFWKERSEAKQGLLKFFPGTVNIATGACGSPTEDLCKVLTRAVVLGSPQFGTAANDAAVTNAMRATLLSFLTSKGDRVTVIRARQQFAALVLNLAAGQLFPSNQKCRFFPQTEISVSAYADIPLNADPSGDPLKLTISDAVAWLKRLLNSSDLNNPQRALEIADDLNNGIGVIGNTPG
jgi:hypothetical protein